MCSSDLEVIGQAVGREPVFETRPGEPVDYVGDIHVASAKQTAFSAAMAKYQNANAARAAARVASLDVLQTQLAQIAAKNKGNETGNRALEALAQVQNDKMMQTMAGIRFVQAQAGGRYWIDPATGLIYNEAEAKARRAKQLEWQQADRTEGAKVGGQILVQRDKAALEAGPDGSPLTKEQRGKMEMERREKQTAVDAMNSQFTAMINKIDITINESMKYVANFTIPDVMPKTTGQTRYRPHGVMAVVGPFNFPMHLPNGHLAPALLAGNTVVFKPSDKAPATGQLLGELLVEALASAGAPPGVVTRR